MTNMQTVREVVRQLIPAFSTAYGSHHGSFSRLTRSTTTSVAPVTGRAAIRAVVEGFMGMASRVDWQVRNVAVTSAGVLTGASLLRDQRKRVKLPVMGTFEVAWKITAWRGLRHATVQTFAGSKMKVIARSRLQERVEGRSPSATLSQLATCCSFSIDEDGDSPRSAGCGSRCGVAGACRRRGRRRSGPGGHRRMRLRRSMD